MSGQVYQGYSSSLVRERGGSGFVSINTYRSPTGIGFVVVRDNELIDTYHTAVTEGSFADYRKNGRLVLDWVRTVSEKDYKKAR